MAAWLWRCVLGVEVALAITGAWFATARMPWSTSTLALAAALIVATWVAQQYLLGLLIVAASRALASAAPGASSWRDACRAFPGEPMQFARAQWAMARSRRAVNESTPGTAPLLLVHGLACNSGVWHALLPRLRAAGFAPIRAIDLEPLAADLETLAHAVAVELGAMHARVGAPVSVLAHSLGGLACRAALRELDPRMVRRLVTVGTPHHGAALARLSHRAPIVQMRPDSAWLAALNAVTPPPVPVSSVFSLDDNFVSPATSAQLAGATAYPLLGLGHFGLLQSRRGAEPVLRALREAA
jgi:triacylglycerol esterase/lipase EstA (alpha/beta hydrolase family)